MASSEACAAGSSSAHPSLSSSTSRRGRTANDYELVRLHVVGNNRQFQSVAGGLIHESSSSLRDEIDFSSKQIGPSAYQIVLNNELGEGEFGFLAPQDTASPKTPASSGQIFTFAIVN
jgi:hypothetical protein